MQRWVKSLEFEVTLVYKEVSGQAGLYRETSKKKENGINQVQNKPLYKNVMPHIN